jgi:CDP-diglyceride synthetase
VVIALYTLIPGPLVLGIAFGLAFGVIFAAAETNFLRGKSLLIKDVVFGFILWLISLALNVNGGLAYGGTYLLEYALVSVVANMIFGYLLGSLYGRYSSKVPTSTLPVTRAVSQTV